MLIAIVGNQNGIGLEVEARLLSEFLRSLGHEVENLQFNVPHEGHSKFDLGIHLEVVNEVLIGLAKRNFYFANPEWLKPSYVPVIKQCCDIVFAKTHEAKEILSEIFPRVEYVGFLTTDKMDRSIPREKKFLHVGGNSGFRNTTAVISAWREYRYWNGLDAPDAPLTIVSRSLCVSFEDTPGIEFYKWASDEQIQRLQNSHLFHLYPSAYEGFGHALHESLSVGAVLLTTDAGPMNEVGAPFTVPSVRQKKNNYGTLHDVSARQIREQIPEMLGLSAEAIELIGETDRLTFENGNAEFASLFTPFLEVPVSRQSSKARIAILGNFRPAHSTENDLKWTLEDMGHQVTAFQEDEVEADKIAKQFKGELLLYVHTHGWKTPGKISIDEMLVELRSQGIKTASFHLDRYRGLNQLDGREDRVGTHPFWRTDTVFTADGGNVEFFKSRGVNHVWLPPAVVKRDCYFGTPREEYAVDVAFVGARGYHPEYPFRQELIEFLEGTYGEKFRLFQGVRGIALNDLYASVQVTVGDSCFAGSDYYWSDRYCETIGRAGFLIAPSSKGLNLPGLVTFTPGDVWGLRDRIDYYLAHPEERDHLRAAGIAWVREHETYHNRMETLLSAMSLL